VGSCKEKPRPRKLLSERNRYIIRRYVSGIGGVITGIAGVALYILTNNQLADRIANWLQSIGG
jgi:hypothetical protein